MSDASTTAAARVSYADLVRFIAAAYRAVGITGAEAEKAAELMPVNIETG